MHQNTSAAQPSLWVSLAAAADYLGVNERTIRRRIAEGALPASRIGPRQIRIRQADLDGLLTPIPAAAGGGPNV